MSHKKAKRQRKIATLATTRMPESACPNCGGRLDAVTGAAIADEQTEKPVPRSGSASICGYCATLLVFDSQLRPRRPTPEMERRILASNPLLAEIQQSWLAKVKAREDPGPTVRRDPRI